jgi:hypothetical protein
LRRCAQPPLLGGEFVLTMADRRARAGARVLERHRLSPRRRAGHGFDGHHHGQWRGRHQVDSDISPCSTAESAARLNQFRDCLIEVHDQETGAIGVGNCQTWVQGAWPQLGLP